MRYQSGCYIDCNFIVGIALDWAFEGTRVCRILNGFCHLRRMAVPEQLLSLIVKLNLFSLLLFRVCLNGLS